MAGPLHNVQALRGVACLAVVLYHLAQAERALGIGFRPLQPFCWFGMAGVDLFFVLSGFIIARSTDAIAGDIRRVPTFLARRAVRILVPFWVWLLAVDIPVDLYSTDRPYTPDLFGPFIRCVFLAAPGEIPRWVPQSWTLSYEAAFYVGVAAVLGMPRRWGAIAWTTWAVALVVHRVTFVPASTAWTNLWFGPLPLEFLAGVAVSKTAGLWSTKSSVTALIVAFAWGVGVYAVSGSDSRTELQVSDATRVLLFGPFAVAMVLVAVTTERVGMIVTNRLWLAAGNASYSIYLVHLTVIYALFRLTSNFGWHHSRPLHILWIALILGGILVVGREFHRRIERPILNRRKQSALPLPIKRVDPHVPQRRAA